MLEIFEIELTVPKLLVVILTASFSLSALLRMFLVHLSWPQQRTSRALGALASFCVALAGWCLLGHRVPPVTYPLVGALLLLGIWQVIDALKGIANLAERRAVAIKEGKEKA